jgi:hypothetical protein
MLAALRTWTDYVARINPGRISVLALFCHLNSGKE